jgi:hypothetical protein
MEQSLVHAIFSGDKNAIFGTASALILSLFLTWILKWVGTQGHAGLKAAYDWWNTKDFGWITKVGNDVIQKMGEALDNHIHLNAAVADAIADGTVSADEWSKIATAALQDVGDSLNVHQWNDVGALLVPGFNAKNTSRTEVEKALKTHFMANAKRLAASSADRSVSRRISRSILKQQATAGSDVLAFKPGEPFTANKSTLPSADASKVQSTVGNS